MFIFAMLSHYKNGAGVWEDFYAKEIARAIDMAKPGDTITIDLDKASIVAKSNDYELYDKLVRFDEKTREIVVKLRTNGETRFSYFNDVKISNVKTFLGVPTNVLQFKVEARNV